MARGKHRLTTPVRLVAAAATVLALGGIVVATGTASAQGARAAGGAVNLEDQVTCQAGHAVALSTMLTKLRGEQPPGESTAFASGQVAGESQSADRAVGGAASSSRLNCARNDDDDGNGGGRNEGGRNNEGDGNDADDDFPGRDKARGPAGNDFIDIEKVSPNVEEPEPGKNASTGSFTSVCGTNGEGHRNSDNFMVAPGKVNGAQHVHDYVGNVSTDAFSDDRSLDDAATTCAQDDQSTYFWPVLRDTDGRGDDAEKDGGGRDGNVGRILQPKSVDLKFRGNPDDEVTAMPEGLAIIMGDAKAVTNGDANAKAAWTCTGFENRTTARYPLCPQGSRLVRILDFPSCWDGENLDSANHRDHVTFPNRKGACRGDTVAVPQLRMTLTYDRPEGKAFALDTFPDQRHDPITDHADFMNMMPEKLMNKVVDCINTDKNC